MKEKTKYQVKCRLHKGDEVIILSGRAKGHTGKIDKVDRKKNKVYIAGQNMYKKHAKPSVSNQGGGIIDKVVPVPIGNVALIDPKTKKATRIGYKIENKKKVRVTKKSDSTL